MYVIGVRVGSFAAGELSLRKPELTFESWRMSHRVCAGPLARLSVPSCVLDVFLPVKVVLKASELIDITITVTNYRARGSYENQSWKKGRMFSRECDHLSHQTWFTDVVKTSTLCHVDRGLIIPSATPFAGKTRRITASSTLAGCLRAALPSWNPSCGLHEEQFWA